MPPRSRALLAGSSPRRPADRALSTTSGRRRARTRLRRGRPTGASAMRRSADYLGGILRMVPIFIVVGSTVGLAAISAERVTPNLIEIAHIVSFFLTV